MDSESGRQFAVQTEPESNSTDFRQGDVVGGVRAESVNFLEMAEAILVQPLA